MDLDTRNNAWKEIDDASKKSSEELKRKNEVQIRSETQHKVNDFNPGETLRSILPSHGLAAGPPVVWAQVPMIKYRSLTEEPLLFVDCVVGGLLNQHTYPQDYRRHMGIPAFGIQHGIVRKYLGQFQVQGEVGECRESATTQPGTIAPSNSTMLSLSRALINFHDPDPNRAADEEVYFNFTGDRYKIPIIEAGEFLRDNGSCKANSLVATKFAHCIGLSKFQASLLEKRVILLGGNFSDARDTFETPLGEMAGVELVAQAVESDLGKGGIRAATWRAALIIHVLSGFVIVLLWLTLRPIWGFFWSVVGGGLLSVLGSLAAFHSFAYWLDFVPILLGIMLHQTFEIGTENEEKLSLAEMKIAVLEKTVQKLQKPR